jgi:hypothetical protein
MKCQYEGLGPGGGECGGKVELHGAMTAYHFEGVPNSPEDPNKDFYCCELHYKDYEEFWQTQWDEYYSSQR